MRVAHVSDDMKYLKPEPGDPQDLGSEWEDERTVLGQIEALEANGHEVIGLPFDRNLIEELQKARPDCVFNISEGRRGKDRESIVPALCRQLDIPCTSSDAVGMGVSLDKSMCKAIARSMGVPTADWALVRCAEDLRNVALEFPLFVKPNFEGSSMGIRPGSLVHSRQDLSRQADWLLEGIGPVLVEKMLEGPELCVALIGNEAVEAFPVAEVRTGGRIYDKSMKSKDRMEEEVICPAPIDDELAALLIGWSKRLFTQLGLAGLARFDYKCDLEGRPMFLEVNPLPGLSKHYSVYTLQAKAAGLSYEAMIGRLVEIAVGRHNRRP